jgi:CDP-diacylglycerol--serine O-phosphatidyltransferase
MNLLFGCLSIVATMQHGLSIQYNPEGIQYLDIPEEIYWASLFIGLSALVDFFDGFVARWLDAVSEMGKQLDSLADVVSFGVAPSMIMFQFLTQFVLRRKWIELTDALPYTCFSIGIVCSLPTCKIQYFFIHNKRI